MITLYTFGRAFGLPDPSPFVTKAECLLRMADLAYETNTKGFKKAPKGKLPYIDDQGKKIADSTFIGFHIRDAHGIDLDQHLTEQQKAIAWSVEKMLEDNLYWHMVDFRWCNDANFAKGPAHFFKSVPGIIRPVITRLVRKQVKKGLHAQGTGRFDDSEKLAIASRCIQSVAAILGENTYLMGDKPCSADASVYAFIGGLRCPIFDSPMISEINKHQNLVDYVKRIDNAYFADINPE